MLSRSMSTYDLEVHDAAAGAVVASLAGELDLTNARELEERLDAAAGADALLIVDINRVVFLDSAALHVLFKLARQRGDERLALLMEPNAAVSRTLDIVGMRHAVRVVSSLDDLGLAETA
jgi:anti-anti-sigma factor